MPSITKNKNKSYSYIHDVLILYANDIMYSTFKIPLTYQIISVKK